MPESIDPSGGMTRVFRLYGFLIPVRVKTGTDHPEVNGCPRPGVRETRVIRGSQGVVVLSQVGNAVSRSLETVANKGVYTLRPVVKTVAR